MCVWAYYDWTLFRCVSLSIILTLTYGSSQEVRANSEEHKLACKFIAVGWILSMFVIITHISI